MLACDVRLCFCYYLLTEITDRYYENLYLLIAKWSYMRYEVTDDDVYVAAAEVGTHAAVCV